MEKGERIAEGGAPLRVFCKRVRKLLTGNELWKHTFFSSAQEFENKEFVFSLFLQKSERVQQEGKRSAERRRAERWSRDDEVARKGQRLRFTRNGTTIVTNSHYIIFMYFKVIRTERASSNE